MVVANQSRACLSVSDSDRRDIPVSVGWLRTIVSVILYTSYILFTMVRLASGDRWEPIVMTYSPHLSPLPHSHVLWISAISLFFLTFKLLKSVSLISATAIDLCAEIEN